MTIKKRVSVTLQMLLWIGFSVQTILGIGWMVANFTGVQLFGESAGQNYLSTASGTGIYSGVLYQALLLLVREIGQMGGFSWAPLMYLLQLALAIFAAAFLLHTIGFFRGNPWLCTLGSLFINTFPLLLQCHMAILPQSLLFSLTCLFFSQIWRCSFVLWLIPKRSLPGVTGALLLARVCFFWLLLALTARMFLYVGGVAVLLLLLWEYLWMQGPLKDLGPEKERARRIVNFQRYIRGWYPAMVAILFCAVILFLGYLTGAGNYTGRSMEKVLFERAAWKTSLMKTWTWPEELKAVVPEEMQTQVSLQADRVQTLLEPYLEAELGKANANRLYGEVAEQIWQLSRGEVLRDAAIDWIGYVCPALVFTRQMTGKGYLSGNIRNYDVMKRAYPLLTRYYVDYSLFFFWIALAACVLIVILEFTKYTGRRILFAGFFIAALMDLILCVFLCLRGSGLLDYKWGVVSTLLWILFIVLQMDRKEAV